MSVADALERYSWADAGEPIDAIALMYVSPVSLNAAGGLKSAGQLPSPMTFEEATEAAFALDDFAWGSELMQVDAIGDWSVLISPVGWATSLNEIVSGLSRGGRAVSMFWNVNAVMSMVVAADGAVVREFDPLLYDDGGTRLPEESDLPFGEPGNVRAAALLLAERLTGVSIDLPWLLGRRRTTYRVSLPPVIIT